MWRRVVSSLLRAQMREMEVNRLVGTWTALQDAVAALMDTTMAANAPEGTQGIRQALEKKEGLFRKNMMGKRVNFAARCAALVHAASARNHWLMSPTCSCCSAQGSCSDAKRGRVQLSRVC